MISIVFVRGRNERKKDVWMTTTLHLGSRTLSPPCNYCAELEQERLKFSFKIIWALMSLFLRVPIAIDEI
jgi:hypothetical protein